MNKILVKIGGKIIECFEVGQSEPHVDRNGVHEAIRVYKITASPVSTFTVKESQVIGRYKICGI